VHKCLSLAHVKIHELGTLTLQFHIRNRFFQHTLTDAQAGAIHEASPATAATHTVSIFTLRILHAQSVRKTAQRRTALRLMACALGAAAAPVSPSRHRRRPGELSCTPGAGTCFTSSTKRRSEAHSTTESFLGNTSPFDRLGVRSGTFLAGHLFHVFEKKTTKNVRGASVFAVARATEQGLL
jgi:hypothetical protein